MKTFILLLGLDVALSLSFEPCIPLLKSIFSHLSIPAPHTFLPLIHWLAQVGQGKRNSVEKEHKGRENCSQCLGRGAWTGRRAHHIYTIVNFALLLFFFIITIFYSWGREMKGVNGEEERELSCHNFPSPTPYF